MTGTCQSRDDLLGLHGSLLRNRFLLNT